MERLESKLDPATNTIIKADKGYFEMRYADKMAYEVIYLSAQSGCNQGCKFCHLTTSGQTEFVNASRQDLFIQVDRGLRQCRNGSVVHFNWMARGEPLNNPAVNSGTLHCISQMAWDTGNKARHLISTIMPRDFCDTYALTDRFYMDQPDIYYSLYSVDLVKRKKFMPNAADPELAIKKLKEWQDYSHKIIRIHFSVVPGFNDTEIEIERLCWTLSRAKLRVDFNLIEYNPPEGETQRPALSLERTRQIIIGAMPADTRIFLIPRVAPDIHVSCGMFFSG